MHPLARVLAVAYVALAVFGTAVYVATSANYINVSQVASQIDGRVSVSAVAIHWSGNPSEPARIDVSVNVTNPGRVRIEVTVVDYELHMDDVADPASWYDAAKLEGDFLGPGGFNARQGTGVIVPPGETRVLTSSVTLEPGTTAMARFNHPDSQGRFHPVVWNLSLTYAFVDFPISNQVLPAPYYAEAGVVPTG